MPVSRLPLRAAGAPTLSRTPEELYGACVRILPLPPRDEGQGDYPPYPSPTESFFWRP